MSDQRRAGDVVTLEEIFGSRDFGRRPTRWDSAPVATVEPADPPHLEQLFLSDLFGHPEAIAVPLRSRVTPISRAGRAAGPRRPVGPWGRRARVHALSRRHRSRQRCRGRRARRGRNGFGDRITIGTTHGLGGGQAPGSRPAGRARGPAARNRAASQRSRTLRRSPSRASPRPSREAPTAPPRSPSSPPPRHPRRQRLSRRCRCRHRSRSLPLRRPRVAGPRRRAPRRGAEGSALTPVFVTVGTTVSTVGSSVTTASIGLAQAVPAASPVTGLLGTVGTTVTNLGRSVAGS